MEEEFSIDKILYIFHNSTTVKVYYVDGKIDENVCSYYALLKVLGENFMRINDNTIVNFNYVKRCCNHNAVIDEETILEIDSKYEKHVVNSFFKSKFEKFNSITK